MNDGTVSFSTFFFGNWSMKLLIKTKMCENNNASMKHVDTRFDQVLVREFESKVFDMFHVCFIVQIVSIEPSEKSRASTVKSSDQKSMKEEGESEDVRLDMMRIAENDEQCYAHHRIYIQSSFFERLFLFLEKS